jgi:hypothetical protein
MQRINESVTTDKSVADIFSFMKEVTKLPEWSLLVESVNPLPDNFYSANTKMGPLKFKWTVDEASKKCTLTANVMGTDYSAYYMVEAKDGKTVISEDIPQNPMVTPDQLKIAIKSELEKLASVA